MKWDMDPQFWRPIIDSARDALKIDLFVLDHNGSLIYFAKEGNRYGSRLLNAQLDIKSTFNQLGEGRWEWLDQYGFSYYAVELIQPETGLVGYLVMGPLILRKRLTAAEYTDIVRKSGENIDEFLERLEEIRVISHFNMEAILATIEALLNSANNQQKVLSSDLVNQKPYDSLLNSFFEVALTFGRAQSGSLMLYNETKDALTICRIKGIKSDYLHASINLGEGVSGKAFKEQKTFILKGLAGTEDLSARYLKRHELKESIVMPFISPKGTIKGVLNMNYLNAETRDLKGINRRLSDVLDGVLENF